MALLVSSAAAVDQPIAGKRLLIRDRQPPDLPLLSFISSDPATLVPAFDSANDPAVSTATRIDIWTQSQPKFSVTIDPGVSANWRRASRRRNAYLYKNRRRGTSVSVMLLTDSGRIRIRMAPYQLFPQGPRGPVAIRVETGSLRNCTLFDASTILRDHGGVFVAANSAANNLPDCEDSTIEAALGESCGSSSMPECGGSCPAGGVCGHDIINGFCRCFPPSQSCVDEFNAPVCNGVCPVGEQCFQIDGIYAPECTCAEVGSQPCGSGGTDCPDGSTCRTLHWSVFGEPVQYHRCIEDSAVCGKPGFGKCDGATECRAVGTPLDFSYQCLPIFCGNIVSSGPTCNRSCPDGLQCSLDPVFNFCLCS